MRDVCEICGESAVHLIADVREIEPTQDEQGRKWRQWEQDRPTHARCSLHERESSTTFLSGTSAADVERMRLVEQEARIFYEACRSLGLPARLVNGE